MEQGIVTRYDKEKCFGFVKDSRGASLFFHLNGCVWQKVIPATGDSLFFERGTDRQGRPCAEHWLPARPVAGLVEFHGCFLAPEALTRYPFLRSILEMHAKRPSYWGIYPVIAKSLARELPALKAWKPSDNVSNFSSRHEYVYVIASGKQPVILRKGNFFMDDIIDPGPSVAEELWRLGYRDADVSAIVHIRNDGGRNEHEYSVIVYV